MTEKCKQGIYKRRTFEGLAPLTREVRNITKPILGQRGFAEVDILGSWPEIIGEDLACGVSPEKLVFDKDKRTGGTLYVKSAGGAFAMLFEFQKQQVIERINGFFGYPAVVNIKIKQGSLKLNRKKMEQPAELTEDQEKRLQEKISRIQDLDLRESAYRVGKEILLKK